MVSTARSSPSQLLFSNVRMLRLDYLSHGQKCKYHRVEVDEETDEMEGQLDQHGVHETFETTLIVDFGRIVHTFFDGQFFEVSQLTYQWRHKAH